jgi:hypothetical protein
MINDHDKQMNENYPTHNCHPEFVMPKLNKTSLFATRYFSGSPHWKEGRINNTFSNSCEW